MEKSDWSEFIAMVQRKISQCTSLSADPTLEVVIRSVLVICMGALPS